jgi:hypothetical protein
MALTTMDPELQRHYQTWVGFTRLMRYVLAVVVIIVALLGYFLG